MVIIMGDQQIPLNQSIFVLGLSRRIVNSLYRNGIKTLEQLLSTTVSQLKSINGLGEKSISDINTALQRLDKNLSLDMDIFPNGANEDKILSDSSIMNLPLSKSTIQLLYRGGIYTQTDLIGISREELRRIYGFQKHHLKELEDFFGFSEKYSETPLFIQPSIELNEAVLNNSILTIGLPVRVANALHRSNIKTIRQLLSISKNDLSSIYGINQVSIEQINNTLNNLSNYIVLDNIANDSARQETPDLEPVITLETVTEQKLLDILFLNVNERAQSIVKYRYGLDGELPHTLQELADELTVTRERIRQICEGAIRSRIRHNATYSIQIQQIIAICKEYLANALISTEENIALYLMDKMSITDINKLMRILVFLNDEVFKAQDEKFGIRLKQSLICDKSLAPDFIWQLVIIVQNHLQNRKSVISIQDLLDFLAKEIPEYQISSSIIEAILIHYPEFTKDEAGNWGLEKWKNHLYDDIVLILRELKRPAHFTEITEILVKRLDEGVTINSHSVHAQLGRYTDLFIRTDSGTFGLREQFPDAPIQPPKYVDLIEEALEEAGIPLSIKKIFEQVNAIREAKYSSITIYLATHGKFMSYGNGNYGLRKWGLSKTKVGDNYIFRYCPIPLAKDNNNPISFFESIIVGYQYLKDNPNSSTLELYDYMLRWANKFNRQENNAQSIFDAWYIVGFIGYVDVDKDKKKQLLLQIPESASYRDIRIHCLKNLCQRLQKMPELLSALYSLHSPNIKDLQRVVFGTTGDGFDIPLRLFLLKSFEAVKENNGVWSLTAIGHLILSEHPPQEPIQLNQMFDNNSDREEKTDDWDNTLDILLI